MKYFSKEEDIYSIINSKMGDVYMEVFRVSQKFVKKKKKKKGGEGWGKI